MEKPSSATKSFKIGNFNQVKAIVHYCGTVIGEVIATDARGSTANAKSLLSMMSLNYSRPVTIEAESDKVITSIRNILSY